MAIDKEEEPIIKRYAVAGVYKNGKIHCWRKNDPEKKIFAEIEITKVDMWKKTAEGIATIWRPKES